MKLHPIPHSLLIAAVLAITAATALAQHNPVNLPDCEPICLRQPYVVAETGNFFYYQWMTVSAPGPSLAGKVQDRFLDAAAVRIYRRQDQAIELTDIGTTGIFRGTNNGWFATGHQDKHQRLLGADAPIAPNQPFICLREDWLDLKAGDIVVIDRLAETTDGRIRHGLGPAGDDLLPWKTDGNVKVDLILHDARAVAAADNWTTHGQGCLEIRNDDRRNAGRAYQVLPAAAEPVKLSFRARTVDADEPVEIACSFAGENVATLTLDNTWETRRISLPAADAGDRGLAFSLPRRTRLQLDDFRLTRQAGSVGQPRGLHTAQPAAPAAASMEALLAGVRPTTIRFGDQGAKLISWPRATIVEVLEFATVAETIRAPLVLSCLHGEQDWHNLIEYLAAPYDPETDTPRLKPYAYRRAVVHGHPRPWVKSVAVSLHLTHNDPAGGDTARRIERAMARYVARTVLPASPYWKDAKDHIRIQLPGDHEASPIGD